MDGKTFMIEVATRLRCDERRAEGVTLAVFQELRDRLTPREAADVAAQLSKPLKTLWGSLDRADRPVRRTEEAEFVGDVRHVAGLADEAEARRAVKAVFGVLQKALGSLTGKEGEAWDIYSQLPKGLKNLWLAASENPEG